MQAWRPRWRRAAEVALRLRYMRYSVVRGLSFYANRYGGILSAAPDGTQSVSLHALARLFQVRRGAAWHTSSVHARMGG